MEGLERKKETLVSILKNYRSVVVAFSGGVDSSLLLKMSYDVLGEKCLGVTGKSDSYPERELEEAKKIALWIGAKHQIIETKEMEDKNYTSNPENRCFYCKSDLFSRLKEIAKNNDFEQVLEGSNLDDISDFRPGRQAVCELDVKSPLLDAGLTKKEVRLLAKESGLPNWNKPSLACLSSRFPYGTEITYSLLERVEKAEDFLRNLGFLQFRVRHHGEIARLEIEESEMHKINNKDIVEKIVLKLKALGYKFVTLDLEGYRTGSMNPKSRIIHGKGETKETP